MKTAYCVSPGIQLPGDTFTWRNVPVIISQPMIWEAMRNLSSGLIFRVRTDKNVGDAIDGQDRIESCVGLIDSTTRWRACFAIVRSALAGLRIPEVAEPCWHVFGLMTSKHPATIAMSDRQQLAVQLRVAIDKLPEGDPQGNFEMSAAAMCMRLVFADNDVEACQVIPYGPLYMVNAGSHADDRESTVEVMVSSVFLAEAGNRLSEKTPQWFYGALPATPGAAVPRPAPTVAQAEPVEAEED